jgi:hypothetical protein
MDTATPGRGRFTGITPVGRHGNEQAHRGTAALVGVLLLTSTAAFAVGSSLVASYFSGTSPEPSTLLGGVLLEVYTGLAVAGIGLAMLPLLRRHDLGLARAYLVLRVLECLALVMVGAYMLATRRQLEHGDLLIYTFTAVGGIVFSYLLLVSGLIPRVLSMLGLVGYLALLVGIPTALLGLADLETGWGMIFLVPGGLFELILPLRLLVKGFSVDTAAGPAMGGPSERSSAPAQDQPGELAVATTTAHDIPGHELLVRSITGSFVIVAGLDVLVAWAL